LRVEALAVLGGTATGRASFLGAEAGVRVEVGGGAAM